ncbi:MAG: hypothetical protein AAF413_02710 [Patescibacteria group bacterium]
MANYGEKYEQLEIHRGAIESAGAVVHPTSPISVARTSDLIRGLGYGASLEPKPNDNFDHWNIVAEMLDIDYQLLDQVGTQLAEGLDSRKPAILRSSGSRDAVGTGRFDSCVFDPARSTSIRSAIGVVLRSYLDRVARGQDIPDTFAMFAQELAGQAFIPNERNEDILGRGVVTSIYRVDYSGLYRPHWTMGQNGCLWVQEGDGSAVGDIASIEIPADGSVDNEPIAAALDESYMRLALEIMNADIRRMRGQGLVHYASSGWATNFGETPIYNLGWDPRPSELAEPVLRVVEAVAESAGERPYLEFAYVKRADDDPELSVHQVGFPGDSAKETGARAPLETVLLRQLSLLTNVVEQPDLDRIVRVPDMEEGMPTFYEFDQRCAEASVQYGLYLNAAGFGRFDLGHGSGQRQRSLDFYRLKAVGALLVHGEFSGHISQHLLGYNEDSGIPVVQISREIDQFAATKQRRQRVFNDQFCTEGSLYITNQKYTYRITHEPHSDPVRVILSCYDS